MAAIEIGIRVAGVRIHAAVAAASAATEGGCTCAQTDAEYDDQRSGRKPVVLTNHDALLKRHVRNLHRSILTAIPDPGFVLDAVPNPGYMRIKGFTSAAHRSTF